MIEANRTNLENVLLFRPETFEDHRGSYVELYNEKLYSEKIKELTGQDVRFVQDDMSRSYKNVLRGIHGDSKTWKLIDCLQGRLYAAIVDCREGKTFGKWQAFTLSQENRNQILVPPGFGTSHLILSDVGIFHYKQSTYYDPENLKQFTYRYDDSRFNIFWPIEKPILSQRDNKRE